MYIRVTLDLVPRMVEDDFRTRGPFGSVHIWYRDLQLVTCVTVLLSKSSLVYLEKREMHLEV